MKYISRYVSKQEGDVINHVGKISRKYLCM